MRFVRLRFHVKGTEKMARSFRKYANRAEQALSAALFQEAEEIMTAAKKLTPVDTGALRSSGHVALPTREGRRVKVQFGFGGPAGSGNMGTSNQEDVGYAIKVHEDLNMYHRVGQAKFLEEPFKAAKRGMAARIAKRMRKI